MAKPITFIITLLMRLVVITRYAYRLFCCTQRVGVLFQHLYRQPALVPNFLQRAGGGCMFGQGRMKRTQLRFRDMKVREITTCRHHRIRDVIST